MSGAPSPIRFGALGAARITPAALIAAARGVPDVRVVAVAARDTIRAREFAEKHSVPTVHGTYEELIADPEIDAIYNPLPNSLHAEWTLRALEAGKHVLCEKPIASNAAEAEQMVDAANRNGRVLMEAFHYRYHPLTERMRDIVRSGDLGRVRHVEAHMCVQLPFPGDIRYRYDLAGGSTMDLGCYAIHLIRHLTDWEPRVVRAEARQLPDDIDRYMEADFEFDSGATARMTCAMLSAIPLRLRATVHGESGRMDVFNPYAPHLFYHRLRVRAGGRDDVERVPGDSTYTHQLRAFVAAVREGAALVTDGRDAVANMRVIDDVYRKSGLKLRGL